MPPWRGVFLWAASTMLGRGLEAATNEPCARGVNLGIVSVSACCSCHDHHFSRPSARDRSGNPPLGSRCVAGGADCSWGGGGWEGSTAPTHACEVAAGAVLSRLGNLLLVQGPRPHPERYGALKRFRATFRRDRSGTSATRGVVVHATGWTLRAVRSSAAVDRHSKFEADLHARHDAPRADVPPPSRR